MEHGDNNYIVCYNDDCKYWRADGKCKYYETGNCIEIVNINGMPVCDSFEKRGWFNVFQIIAKIYRLHKRYGCRS